MSISNTPHEFSDLESSNEDKGFYDTLKNYANKIENDKAAAELAIKNKPEGTTKQAK